MSYFSPSLLLSSFLPELHSNVNVSEGDSCSGDLRAAAAAVNKN